jgi:outer membrane biosynthesis protein TonB
MKTKYISLIIYLVLHSLLSMAQTTPCRTPMAAAGFNQLINAIREESFSSNKMDVAKQGIRCVSVEQVRSIMNEFSFESEKLEFAKFAYPRTVDKENYFMLNSAFSFSSSKAELNKFVQSQQKTEPEPEPELEITTRQRPQREPTPTPQPTPNTQRRQPQQPRNRTQQPLPQPNPTQQQDVYGWKAYQEALRRYQQYFDMVIGNETDIIGDTKGPQPHHSDEDSRMAPKAPRIVITSPELINNDGWQATTNDKRIKVEGVISSTVGIYEVFVNETEAILTPNGTFSAEVLLAMGENLVKIRAVDVRRQTSNISFKVTRLTGTPTPQPEPVVVKEDSKPTPPPTPPANFVSDVDTNLPVTKMSNPNAIAVVIGNTAYTRTKPVDFATNDAKSVRNYLIKVLGYKPGNILYYENASLGDFNMLFGGKSNHKGKLFNTIKQNVSDVFIFFSGHGAPGLQDNKGYFVPVEADPNYIEQSGYCIETLYENLAKLPAKSITLVTDACFSGANIFESISPIVIKAKTPPPTVIKNAVFLSSSSGTEVSSWYNEQRHGLFTYFFLKAMQDHKTSDLNKDKKLTFDEIFKYLSDNNEGVPYYARRIHGINQNPRIQGSNRSAVFVTYP